jgi:hypothetical protein
VGAIGIFGAVILLRIVTGVRKIMIEQTGNEFIRYDHAD